VSGKDTVVYTDFDGKFTLPDDSVKINYISYQTEIVPNDSIIAIKFIIPWILTKIIWIYHLLYISLHHYLLVSFVEEYKEPGLSRSFNKTSLEYNQVVDYSPSGKVNSSIGDLKETTNTYQDCI